MELLETRIWWLRWPLYYVTLEWVFTGLDFCTILLSAALLSVVGLCNHLHLMPIYVSPSPFVPGVSIVYLS